MPWFLKMLLTLFPVILLIQIYVALSIHHSLKQIWPAFGKRGKIILYSLLLYLNLLPIIIILASLSGGLSQLFLFQNHLTLPDFIILFPYWWGLILVVEIFPYYLLMDLVRLLSRLPAAQKLRVVLRPFPYLRIGLLVVLALYVSTRLYLDSNHISNSHHHITVTELPETLSGLKVALLGDIQVDRYTQEHKLRQVREKVNALKPDLILFTGDLVTNGRHFVKQGIELLCRMDAAQGKLACMGDHDHWSAPQMISGGLMECGWFFIENAHRTVDYNGHKILITGITHIYSRQLAQPELEKLLAAAPAAELKILLVHQPAPVLIEIAQKYGYHAVLAGHTHGGQVQFRPLGMTFTLSMFETPYFSGEYRFKNLTVIVTNGIGLTFAPVRYQAPAEISVLHFLPD